MAVGLGCSDQGAGPHGQTQGAETSGTSNGGATTGGEASEVGTGGAVTPGSAGGAGNASGSGSSGAKADGAAGSASGGVCQESDCGSHKWACWQMPTPTSNGAGVANPQKYTDLGNGAVRDDVTCLVWEQANPAEQGTWQKSFDRCAARAASKYAGFDDWRLPTRIEMASITDVTLGKIGYPTIFEVTPGYYVTGSDWYKTILTDQDGTAGNEANMVWGYGTNGFTSNAIVRTNTNNVTRCVRGNGAGEAAGDYAKEPANHYTVGDGVVKDNYTGLTWQQGRSPALMAWADAEAYCAGLALDGGGFRVPSLSELATSVNEAKVGGAIVSSAFPDNPVGCKAPEYWFWAREASQVGGTGWGLSYCDGFTGWNGGESGAWNYFPSANVRCVK